MSEKFLQAQVALACAIDRIRNSERGQGSAEYAGVIVVAVILVVALTGAAGGWGTTLTSKIGELVDKIFQHMP